MMVGISPVRNSPTIRRRRKHAQLTATALVHQTPYVHRCGCLAGLMAVALLCLWHNTKQNSPLPSSINNAPTSSPRLYEPSPSSSQTAHHLRARNQHSASSLEYDAIVVGSGLAGLTTTLELLDRGARVALVEKEATLGGNSLKASSGINACCDEQSPEEDSLQAFAKDTTKSAADLARPDLIDELVGSSASALKWLQERVGVDLSQIAQLGGHSQARTHRPAQGMVGAELIANLEQSIRTYEKETHTKDEGSVTIYTHHPVTQLLQNQHDNKHEITGVQIRNAQSNATTTLTAPQVVLATGGFASDRRPTSLLGQVRPDLARFGTTGGSFSTGDGIALATSLGAHTIDMKEIQLHPTGFVDPANPHEGTKVLAAELLRGVGGILLNPENGNRFCNELGTRDYVTHQMLSQHASDDAFALVLAQQAAQQATKHVELYRRKGLLTKVHGVQALADWMKVPLDSLRKTFVDYQSAMEQGKDAFGKTVFNGFPTAKTTDWENQVFFVGKVTPVLHYCMGGLSVDVDGHVLNEGGSIIQGLYAAGEVAGGVHGKNRLGGNSLLECTVFGRKIGQQLELRNEHSANVIPERHQPHKVSETVLQTDAIISPEELQTHNKKDDMWMALHGVVYNLTAFASQHPGGVSILETMAGTEATEAFATVHSPRLLQQFHSQPGVVVGKLDPSASSVSKPTTRTISRSELKQHNTKEDCWVAFHGQVYDMTEFSKVHKGGAYLIQKYAGKDATDTYKAFHKKDKLGLVAKYLVGPLGDVEATTA